MLQPNLGEQTGVAWRQVLPEERAMCVKRQRPEKAGSTLEISRTSLWWEPERGGWWPGSQSGMQKAGWVMVKSGFYPKAVASNFDVEKLIQPVRKGQGRRGTGQRTCQRTEVCLLRCDDGLAGGGRSGNRQEGARLGDWSVNAGARVGRSGGMRDAEEPGTFQIPKLDDCVEHDAMQLVEKIPNLE